MFLNDYFIAPFTNKEGKNSQVAFAAGKGLSDIAGMLNRAAWLFGLGLLIWRVQGHYSATLPFWSHACFFVTTSILCIALPALLIVQIFVIGVQNIFVSTTDWRPFVAIVFTVIFIALTGAVAVTGSYVQSYFLDQEHSQLVTERTKLDAQNAELAAISKLSDLVTILANNTK